MPEPMSAQTMLSKARQAEAEGIPVDWAQVADRLYFAAEQGMRQLQEKIDGLEQECVDGGLREAGGGDDGDGFSSDALDKVFAEDEELAHG
jgi:hypothetical protein